MKAIRFRQRLKNDWHYWGFINMGHGLVFVGPITGKESLEDTCRKSNQFTGLKDKNGKEIYEGDIVEYKRTKWNCSDTCYHQRNPNDRKTLTDICLVYWDDEHHGFCNDQRHPDDITYAYCSGELGFYDERAKQNIVKIIGNIYENPELLKGDK